MRMQVTERFADTVFQLAWDRVRARESVDGKEAKLDRLARRVFVDKGTISRQNSGTIHPSARHFWMRSVAANVAHSPGAVDYFAACAALFDIVAKELEAIAPAITPEEACVLYFAVKISARQLLGDGRAAIDYGRILRNVDRYFIDGESFLAQRGSSLDHTHPLMKGLLEAGMCVRRTVRTEQDVKRVMPQRLKPWIALMYLIDETYDNYRDV